MDPHSRSLCKIPDVSQVPCGEALCSALLPRWTSGLRHRALQCYRDPAKRTFRRAVKELVYKESIEFFRDPQNAICAGAHRTPFLYNCAEFYKIPLGVQWDSTGNTLEILSRRASCAGFSKVWYTQFLGPKRFFAPLELEKIFIRIFMKINSKYFPRKNL